ncbi:hypothetical protein HXX76_006334 [Chlamydomonas incerta]|uniref:Uncharacterized protein n=1 Tax=Chlamydomonas incerta TaxID=51695 RepID=A0A835W175_CHLIN|nr:hypothetical protein HXX76_006334 [Chlamydomonas incerta]|eukprot:KAG2436812.1 hypothetical protein HXX76_006334 [Chlamydomonas incerta]
MRQVYSYLQYLGGGVEVKSADRLYFRPNPDEAGFCFFARLERGGAAAADAAAAGGADLLAAGPATPEREAPADALGLEDNGPEPDFADAELPPPAAAAAAARGGAEATARGRKLAGGAAAAAGLRRRAVSQHTVQLPAGAQQPAPSAGVAPQASGSGRAAGPDSTGRLSGGSAPVARVHAAAGGPAAAAAAVAADGASAPAAGGSAPGHAGPQGAEDIPPPLPPRQPRLSQSPLPSNGPPSGPPPARQPKPAQQPKAQQQSAEAAAPPSAANRHAVEQQQAGSGQQPAVRGTSPRGAEGGAARTAVGHAATASAGSGAAPAAAGQQPHGARTGQGQGRAPTEQQLPPLAWDGLPARNLRPRLGTYQLPPNSDAAAAAAVADQRSGGLLPPAQPGELRLLGLTFHPSATPLVQQDMQAWPPGRSPGLPLQEVLEVLEPAKQFDVRTSDEELALYGFDRDGIVLEVENLLFPDCNFTAPLQEALPVAHKRVAVAWDPGLQHHVLVATRQLPNGSALGVKGGYVLPAPEARAYAVRGYGQCSADVRAELQRRLEPKYGDESGAMLSDAWRLVESSLRMPYPAPAAAAAGGAAAAAAAAGGGLGGSAGAARGAGGWQLSELGYGGVLTALVTDARVQDQQFDPDRTADDWCSDDTARDAANCAVVHVAVRGLVLPVLFTTKAMKQNDRLLGFHGPEWRKQLDVAAGPATPTGLRELGSQFDREWVWRRARHNGMRLHQVMFGSSGHGGGEGGAQ